MGFKVAVVYFSHGGRLVTFSNVIAEGARSVEGAQVTVYRIKDPIRGDIPDLYEEGALDPPVITHEAVQEADCLIIGGPGIGGGMCATVRHFLDGLTEFQTNGCLLKGKVGAAFTSTGGEPASCYSGHEAVLASVHATFLQHAMVVLGVPPTKVMEDASLGTPFGAVMNGKVKADKAGSRLMSLTESEVKLAYAQGEWAAQVAKQLHDAEEGEEEA